MDSFNEIRSKCKYRDKQNCKYWYRITQCHQLSCPLLSQRLSDQAEMNIPKRTISSKIRSYNDYQFDRIKPLERKRSENIEERRYNKIHPKQLYIQETEHTKSIPILTIKKEIPKENKTIVKEVTNNYKIPQESLDSHLKEKTHISATKILQSRPQSFQEVQETIITTPRQIICERCGNLIKNETCTRIRYSNGEIFYIHSKGQCKPNLEKIEKVRDKWLEMHK